MAHRVLIDTLEHLAEANLYGDEIRVVQHDRFITVAGPEGEVYLPVECWKAIADVIKKVKPDV